MYAVIETGGKQYRVELGTELAVERLEAEPGSSITLDRVLLVADGDDASIGRPLVADAAVAAEVVAQDRADKLIVFKYRPKARRRVKKGHRQERTVLRISDIRFNGRSAADDARKAQEDAKTERQRLQEAAARQAAEDAALAAKLADRAAPAPAAPAKGRGRGKASAEATPTTAKTATEPTSSKSARTRRSTKPAAAGEAETTETTPTTDAGSAGPAPKRSRTKKDQ
jgi:large subunit ribosomal protein L21